MALYGQCRTLPKFSRLGAGMSIGNERLILWKLSNIKSLEKENRPRKDKILSTFSRN